MDEPDEWGRIVQSEQAQEEHNELHPRRDKLVYCLSPDPDRPCSSWPNCDCGHDYVVQLQQLAHSIVEAWEEGELSEAGADFRKLRCLLRTQRGSDMRPLPWPPFPWPSHE